MNSDERILSASVMCSDPMRLGEEVDELEQLGVQWLHIDVMDGHFVPNLTFGTHIVDALHERTSLPLDIHLMVTDPELIMERFSLRPGDIVTAHVELGRTYADLSRSVRSKACLFGIALNPETPVGALEPYLGLFDTVTLMLVHPGFAGARMVDGIMDKVGLTRRWLDAHGCRGVRISVDGSVSVERAAYMAEQGAGIFVGGTAGIYRKGMSLSETVPLFLETVNAHRQFPDQSTASLVNLKK